ncbi:DUF5662 family protein [Anaerotardibacter muris]|uniref:DUF5662 family protein n=1 Tax=Anaerotardibacter muris TaxID=2941505 RepID=UPI002042427F|nr:DUF5662 family protein [Anaerotardibacter muris]
MPEKSTPASEQQNSQHAEHIAELKASLRTPDKRATTPVQYLKNAWAHFGTISHHKALVFELCVRCGIPWQGLVHDLSKYSPEEFLTGVRFYQGNRSPNTAERNANGFSRAWIHHKGRNKHHYEYWTDMRPGKGGMLVGNLIPTKYMVEMFCDRVAASKVYAKDNYRDSSPLEYLQLELTAGNLPFHPESAAFLYVLLEHLAEHGEDETLRFIRKNIIEARYVYAPGATFD